MLDKSKSFGLTKIQFKNQVCSSSRMSSIVLFKTSHSSRGELRIVLILPCVESWYLAQKIVLSVLYICFQALIIDLGKVIYFVVCKTGKGTWPNLGFFRGVSELRRYWNVSTCVAMGAIVSCSVTMVTVFISLGTMDGLQGSQLCLATASGEVTGL